jgi:hypothetical protein
VFSTTATTRSSEPATARGARSAARRPGKLGQPRVERRLLRFVAALLGDMDQHDLVASLDPQPGVQQDQVLGAVLLDDLVAVALGGGERLDQRLMDAVRE